MLVVWISSLNDCRLMSSISYFVIFPSQSDAQKAQLCTPCFPKYSSLYFKLISCFSWIFLHVYKTTYPLSKRLQTWSHPCIPKLRSSTLIVICNFCNQFVDWPAQIKLDKILRIGLGVCEIEACSWWWEAWGNCTSLPLITTCDKSWLPYIICHR